MHLASVRAVSAVADILACTGSRRQAGLQIARRLFAPQPPPIRQPLVTTIGGRIHRGTFASTCTYAHWLAACLDQAFADAAHVLSTLVVVRPRASASRDA